MKVSHHQQILGEIQARSGTATKHTFLNSYLGNQHPRYSIGAAELRTIAKDWIKAHRDLAAIEFAKVISDLIHGESSTEKHIAGMLLDYSTTEQRKFDPGMFDEWLDHLVGWAEVDAVCTNKYTRTEVSRQWKRWKNLSTKFSKSENINKRRAALVIFCSPLSQLQDDNLANAALVIVDRLKPEKHILITKAISWLLRSMVKHHRSLLEEYLDHNLETLPKIAVRETFMKLKTGKKNNQEVVNHWDDVNNLPGKLRSPPSGFLKG
jgi:3-methyladenine DNA glycosylase AlkD